MHPAYDAGHATVVDACVTMLKAFFDTSTIFARPEQGTPRFKHYAASDKPASLASDLDCHDPSKGPSKGKGTKLIEVECKDFLTLENELNKLSANISVGRNMAGVQFQRLLRQPAHGGGHGHRDPGKTSRSDPFALSIPTYDGQVRRIGLLSLP